MMTLCCSFQLVQTLTIGQGCTQSIFPAVEQWLNATSDHYKALEYVAARKQMTRYQDVVDFVFCELHPIWRGRCMAFYEDEGPALVEQISEEQRARFERRMLALLGIAYEAFCAHRRLCWSGAVSLVEQLAA